MLAMELIPANIERVIGALGRIGRQYPDARAVVLSQRGLERYEWLLREAGAVHIVFSPRQLTRLASMIKRHLDAVPVVELPLAERILTELPWRERGTPQT